MALPFVYLARHGETAWAAAGRHTGRTDVPLTEKSEADARRPGGRIADKSFARVWTSPAVRARRTWELAGFAAVAVPDPDLWEWDYGEYEGLRAADVRIGRPGWQLFRDGCPCGGTEKGATAEHNWSEVRLGQVGGLSLRTTVANKQNRPEHPIHGH